MTVDKETIRKEIFRKLIHLCSAFIPLFLSFAYWLIISGLVLVVIIYIIAEILRLKGYKIPIISFITEKAARQRDENKFVFGPVTLVLGILLAALILPLEYAKIGIYALSFGDGFASLIGKAFGRITIPFTGGKTLAGSLACFTAVFICTLIVTRNPLITLLVALVAMLIEVLPLSDFDNIIIPIAIGSWYYLLCILL